jgi:hypothetical protein
VLKKANANGRRHDARSAVMRFVLVATFVGSRPFTTPGRALMWHPSAFLEGTRRVERRTRLPSARAILRESSSQLCCVLIWSSVFVVNLQEKPPIR